MIQNQNESEEKICQRIENIIRTAIQEEEQRRNQGLEHQSKIDALVQGIKQVENQISTIGNENIRNQKLLKLNEEQNSCYEKLNDTNHTIEKLENTRDQAICMWRYWVSIVIQSVCVILIIIFGLRYIFIDINSVMTWSDFVDQNIGLIITGCFSILSFIAGGVARLSILQPVRAYKKHREELLQEWNNDHPEYNENIQERTNLLSKIANLKWEINILKNQN